MPMSPELVAAIIASVLSGLVLFGIQSVARGMRRVEEAVASIRESLAAEKQIRIDHERRIAKLEGKVEHLERDINSALAR